VFLLQCRGALAALPAVSVVLLKFSAVYKAIDFRFVSTG